MGHTNSPDTLNIGIYRVRASAKTTAFFQALVDILKPSALSRKFNFTDPEGKAQTKAYFDQQIFTDCAVMHQQPVNWPHWEMYAPCKPFKENRIAIQTIPNNIMAAGDPPLATAELTVAHVLDGTPLNGPLGKLVIAKELGFWPDVDGYHTSPKNRYMVMSGNAIKFNQGNTYGYGMQVVRAKEGQESAKVSTQSVLALTVFMAQTMQRILVLPKVGKYQLANSDCSLLTLCLFPLLQLTKKGL